MVENRAASAGAGQEPGHHPVLYHEIIHALRPSGEGRYVDATVGAGGHAWGILNASRPNGLLLGMDVDPQALALAQARLHEFSPRFTLVEASYTSLPQQMERLGWASCQGIVADLGVSSMQLDSAARGFSFQAEGPLDMRFNPSLPVSAEDVVNGWPERDLADVIYRFGEEQQSRRIARAIVQARPLHTTRALAEVISKAAGGRKGKVHPATKTFQALRIAVNQELEAVETFLPLAVSALEAGGRLAVIAFHSLEDRIVKQFFRRESRDCICPPEQPVCTCGHRASVIEVNRHPITASDEEIASNPRSRSARLRIVEKI